MHDSVQPPHITLGVAHAAASSQLSALLALQRAEEPEISIRLCEASSDDLIVGIRHGKYDVAISLADVADATVCSQPLWRDDLAIAVPLRSALLAHPKLTLDLILEQPMFRWQAEVCPELDRQIVAARPEARDVIRDVTSFEMMALWVAAGYGVGITAQSRTLRAQPWGICVRPFRPYTLVTHLLRPTEHLPLPVERFARRALQIAAHGMVMS